MVFGLVERVEKMERCRMERCWNKWKEMKK